MRTLSDMPRDIDVIWVIDHGRHTIYISNIQRVISPIRDKAWAIAPRDLAQILAYLPVLHQNGEPNDRNIDATLCLIVLFCLVHAKFRSQSSKPGTLFCRVSEGKFQAQNRRHL